MKIKELDVGDVVFHYITNSVYWVSGNCHIKFRDNMLLNMDMVFCVNKSSPGNGIVIPRFNLTHLPLPNHINSNVVFNLYHINQLIEHVESTMTLDNEEEVLPFINKAKKMYVKHRN